MAEDENYLGVILEDIRDQNTKVLESVVMMQDKMETLATKEDLNELTTRIDTLQGALKDTNKGLADHESRITHLEQAA